MRTQHNLIQGSVEWCEFRHEHDGASEAAAALGLSKKVSRAQLLHEKATKLPREFSEWVQRNILDYGHEVEALARPIIEARLGVDFYPSTWSDGKLSASCDGLTLDETIGFECKQYNKELFASVLAGIVPEEYLPQVQQCMMVTGAPQWVFACSDSTDEGTVHIVVDADPVWHERIRLGWEQFDIDLANYVVPEVVAELVAEPVMQLPALSIRVDGAVSLVGNLPAFMDRLQSFLAGINREPSTDQEFADAENHIKALQAAEDALEQAESSALAQTSSIDEMRRMVALGKQLSRENRLSLEKIVKARKVMLRDKCVIDAIANVTEHIAALNKDIGSDYIACPPDKFGEAVKNKKSLKSIQEAVAVEVARLKVETKIIAERVKTNLAALKEFGSEHRFLFQDHKQLMLGDAEAVTAIIKARIAEHEAKQAARIAAQVEAERTRIRAEEEARAKAEAVAEAKRVTDKARAEEAALAAKVKAEREAEAKEIERVTATVFASPVIEEARSAAQFGAAVAVVKMDQAPRQNPGLNAILFTLSERYEVSTEVAAGWLRELIGEKAA